MGAALPGTLAEWPQRALGGLVDYVAPWAVYVVVSRISGLLGLVVWLAAMGFSFYNAYLNGSTGQSIGKQVAGLKVVSEQTGQVIGGGMGIVRWIVGGAISLVTCGIGGLIDLLFPLWDSKKQTLHDKIMKTVVVTVPK
ncbi:MAG: RDD family protein [Acidimicrobiia bacterium]|nr:RDD family protein [Acidimicrobiia bacterium]